MSITLALILSLLGFGLIVFAAVFNHLHGSLNIEAKTVGNGQFGTSRFSTK